jgi:hypothetical protein
MIIYGAAKLWLFVVRLAKGCPNWPANFAQPALPGFTGASTGWRG